MQIEILTIGDELLLGLTIDTNGPHLARELADVGVTVVRRSSVGDGADEIAAAVRESLDRTGAVITTGGLGPTADDLTKPSIAALFGRGMVLDESILAALEARWKARFARDLPASNRQQAMLPAGARVLVNRHGSAPGVWLEDERGRWVAMLPGVPREMRGMLADELGPIIAERARAGAGGAPTVVRSRTLRTTSIAESAIADRLGDLARGAEGCSLAYLPGREGTDLRLTSRGRAAEETDAALARAGDLVRARVADWVYGEENTDLAAVVLDHCRARGLTIAVAESCTGGLLGARLTSVAGSSDVVRGGVIAYANDVKTAQLGVDAAAIASDGAVSEKVAAQMAAGARARIGADVGVALTGVAGPGGGSEEKPVGTVWIGVDVGGDVRTVRNVFTGDREEIRYRAAQFALDLVRRALTPGARPEPTPNDAVAAAAR
ncbi:putative competence-damage inducible protein [Gemmatimonadetes bacterium T265]|nr:putative competence-damage inducible protein [Gemmatimonadetes bacterium T265]